MEVSNVDDPLDGQQKPFPLGGRNGSVSNHT